MGQKSITLLLIDIGPTNSAELDWKKLSTQVIHKKLIYRLKTDLVGIVSLGKIKEKKETLSDTVRVIKKPINARSEDIKLIENLTSTSYEANVLEGLIECCNLLTEDFKLKDYTKQIILISKLPYISKNSENSDFIQQRLIRAINLLNINLTWWGGDPSNITNNTEFNQFFLKLKNREFVEFEKSKDLYHIWDTQLDEARAPTSLFFIDFILGSDDNNLKFPLVGFKHFVVADEKINIIEAKKAETKRKNAEKEGEEEYNYYLGATKVPSDFVLQRMDLSESSARVHGFIPLSNIQVLHFHSPPIHFYLKNTATQHECQLWVDFIEALLEIERAALVRLNISKKNNQNNPKILSMALMIPKKRTDNSMPYFICRLLPFQREDIQPHLIDPIPHEQELNEEQIIEDFMNQLTISENFDGEGNEEGIDLSRLVRPPMKNDSELDLDDLIQYLPSQIRENLKAWDSNDADLKKVFDKYTQES